MKTCARIGIVGSTILITLTTARASFVVRGLYNTGVDARGDVLPLESVDPHYMLTYEGASGTAYVAPIVYHSPASQAWVTPPDGSAWIGPSDTGSTYPIDPPGHYSYAVTFAFSLLSDDPASVEIFGYWATDNTGEIWVNGLYSGFNKGSWGFDRLDPFLLSGFHSGENTIEFRVYNEYGPTGLLVAGLEAADDGRFSDFEPPATIPEPSPVVAGALLLVPLLWRVALGRGRARA